MIGAIDIVINVAGALTAGYLSYVVYDAVAEARKNIKSSENQNTQNVNQTPGNSSPNPQKSHKVSYAIFTTGLASLGLQALLFGKMIEGLITNQSLLKNAAVASVAPPVINTLFFAMATTHTCLQIYKLIVKKPQIPENLNEQEKAIYAKNWSANRRREAVALGLELATSVVFLASSVVPIPGLTNVIGLAVGGSVVGFDALVRVYNAYKNRQNEKMIQDKNQPASSFSNSPNISVDRANSNTNQRSSGLNISLSSKVFDTTNINVQPESFSRHSFSNSSSSKKGAEQEATRRNTFSN